MSEYEILTSIDGCDMSVSIESWAEVKSWDGQGCIRASRDTLFSRHVRAEN